jgi:hypothetical protein
MGERAAEVVARAQGGSDRLARGYALTSGYVYLEVRLAVLLYLYAYPRVAVVL